MFLVVPGGPLGLGVLGPSLVLGELVYRCADLGFGFAHVLVATVETLVLGLLCVFELSFQRLVKLGESSEAGAAIGGDR